MKINGGNSGPIRPDRTSLDVAAQGDAKGARARPTPSQLERLDRVEISDAGRARSAQLEPTSPAGADRLAEIRQRVLQGAYDTDHVVEEVARRILERGDL